MNGPHKHYCEICAESVDCQAVTHCSLPSTSICFREHTRGLLDEFLSRMREARNDELAKLRREREE
jgi:hypothetical protein